MTTPDGDEVDAATLLRESVEDLGEYLRQANSIGLPAIAAQNRTPGAVSDGLWLPLLESRHDELAAHVDAFLQRYARDPYAAGYYLDDQLEPFLQADLLPLIESFRRDAEEAVALEVESVSARAGAAARGLIGASVLALAMALGLGAVLWNSISRPLTELTDATAQIGRGRLETRVPVRSRDELGALATAINQMAEQLATTTVSMENLDNIIDSAAGAFVVLDGDGRVIRANRATAELLGFPSGDLNGTPFAEICDGGVRGTAVADEADEIMDEVMSGERIFRRRDGSEVPVSFAAAVLRGDEGAYRGHVCLAQDLSVRKSMEERLKRSLAEKELLLREVHHRVKNNLQVISSLLDLQADQLGESQAREAYADSQRRIRSMALIHQQLYGAESLDRIDFSQYLDSLVASLFSSFGERRVRLETEIGAAQLPIDQALACGLIVNELVTNALKHAFGPDTDGCIIVRFAEKSSGRYRLEVADDGCGLAEEGPVRAGSLGMRLVAAFVDQLRGELASFNDGGAVFRIEFAAADQIPAAGELAT